MPSHKLPFMVDYAKSGRSKCNTTKEKIPSGTLRLATMVKSQHFDGMQPNWNDAKEFLTLQKTKRKRPMSVDEIYGYDDLRPADQRDIENWIKAYGGGGGSGSGTGDKKKAAKGGGDDDVEEEEEKVDEKLKKGMEEQSSLVWKIRDLQLSMKTVKSILELNGIKSLSSPDQFVKRLAECVVFGVPTTGDAKKGCCASRPLYFSAPDGRYVCRAAQTWGECTYSQSVEKTICHPIKVPPVDGNVDDDGDDDEEDDDDDGKKKKKPKKLSAKAKRELEEKKKEAVSYKAWLSAVKKLKVGPAEKSPRQRLYVKRKRKLITAEEDNDNSINKKQKTAASSTPSKPKKKAVKKPEFSRAAVDPESGLSDTHHVLDEGYFTGKGNAAARPDPKERFPIELYDTSLSMTDFASGINSQYKLQILVADKDRRSYESKNRRGALSCQLWRVWGRIGSGGGNNNDDGTGGSSGGGGGTKLEEFFSIEQAKNEFRKLFKKRTENEWTDRKIFVKHPRRFYQLDISYADNMKGGKNKNKKGKGLFADDSDDSDADSDVEYDDDGNVLQKVTAGDVHSKLPLRVQEIIASMFDKGIAKTQLEEMNIDLSKMPLGKMTEAQLRDAYSVLTQIESILINEENEQKKKKQNQGDGDDDNDEEEEGDGSQDVDADMRLGMLRQFSNQFYSKCPTTDPILIDSMKVLKKKIEMVDELINLQASNQAQRGDKNDDDDDDDDDKKVAAVQKAPVDEAYEKLNTELTPLDPTGDEYQLLNKYVENTRNATIPTQQNGIWAAYNDWGQKGLRLLDAFKVEREGEAQRFEPKKKQYGNRRLLWHGSRISNYTGILSQGLRIAPPEAPCSGYRFGKGVYFADMLGKSANYCRTNGSAEMLVMACDVSLGKTYETPHDMYMEKPQPGTNSTHALSEIVPDPTMSLEIPDEVSNDGGQSSLLSMTASKSTMDGEEKEKVLVPLGKPIASKLTTRPSCDVSEFIVYDQAQVHIRYLLRLTTNPTTKAAHERPDLEAASKPGGGGIVSTSADAATATTTAATTTATAGPGSKKRKLKDDEKKNKKKKEKEKKTSAFIGLEREDRSMPSRSGLAVLNCRTFVEGLRLTVVQGDITNSKTQAIILPSDSSLSLSGMVGQAVQRKAGPTFADEINRTDKTKSVGGDDDDDDEDMFDEDSSDEEMEDEEEDADPVRKPSKVTTKADFDSSKLPSTILWLGTLNDPISIREIADDVGVLQYSTAYFKVTKKEMIPHGKGLICIGTPNNAGTGGKFYRTGREAKMILDIGENDKKAMITPEQIPPGIEVYIESTGTRKRIPSKSSILLELPKTEKQRFEEEVKKAEEDDEKKAKAKSDKAANKKKKQEAMKKKKEKERAKKKKKKANVKRVPLETSDAIIIGGHNLEADHVVFVVSPHYTNFSGANKDALAETALRRAVKNCLTECSKIGLRTVTLPSIGSGVAGYDKGKAAKWIIAAIAEYLEDAANGMIRGNPAGRGGGTKMQSIEEVCFCLFDQQSLDAYKQGIVAHDKATSVPKDDENDDDDDIIPPNKKKTKKKKRARRRISDESDDD